MIKIDLYHSSVRALLKRHGLPIGSWMDMPDGRKEYTGRLTVQQHENGVLITDLEYGKGDNIFFKAIQALIQLPFSITTDLKGNKLFVTKL